MANVTRPQAESNVYHITVRGVGRQIIFEDDEDRQRFTTLLQKRRDDGLVVYAWCLMSNHVHLLVKSEMPSISNAMLRLETAYARYFNKKYDRVGHLFQGRFGSVAVADDKQLLTTVRYIHLNPNEYDGVDYRSYPWSSYHEYLGTPDICDTSLVLAMVGGKAGFKAIHTQDSEQEVEAPDAPRVRLTEADALRIAKEIVTPISLTDVKALPKNQRNELLKQLRKAGLSIRQIERLTGISRGIVSRM